MIILIVESFPSKALQDGTQKPIFKIYVVVIGAYAGAKMIISLLTTIPCCHGLTEACHRWSVVRLVKWMHQVLVFFIVCVGVHAHSYFPNLFCMQHLPLRISDIWFLLKEQNYVGRGMHESALDYIK